MAAAVDRLQLFDTDPRGAFLVSADLQAVLLRGAHPRGSSLRDADRRGAFLVRAVAQRRKPALHGTAGAALPSIPRQTELGIWSMPTSAARSPTPRRAAGRLRCCRGRHPVRMPNNRQLTRQCLVASGGEWPIPCHSGDQPLALISLSSAAVAGEADPFPATFPGEGPPMVGRVVLWQLRADPRAGR
jgi:hypothetical protein